MTIQECYKKMGADYEDVLKRLYSEGMIRKFARMFLDDDSYPKLERSLKEENVEEAFRAAHTLKGVCQNLGFTNLYQPIYELTEVLRAGTLEGSKEWFDRVTEQYNITIDAIRAVQQRRLPPQFSALSGIKNKAPTASCSPEVQNLCGACCGCFSLFISVRL